MTRDELKSKMTGLVDEIVETDRELTDEDEDKLSDQFGSDLIVDLTTDDADGEEA